MLCVPVHYSYGEPEYEETASDQGEKHPLNPASSKLPSCSVKVKRMTVDLGLAYYPSLVPAIKPRSGYTKGDDSEKKHRKGATPISPSSTYKTRFILFACHNNLLIIFLANTIIQLRKNLVNIFVNVCGNYFIINNPCRLKGGSSRVIISSNCSNFTGSPLGSAVTELIFLSVLICTRTP